MSDEHELARECEKYAQAALSPTNRDFHSRMAAELKRLKAENDAAQDLRMRLYGIIGEMAIKLEQIGKILGNPGQDPKG